MLEISRRADFSEIPVIDIGALGRAGTAEADVIKAIRDASMHVGFFYVTDHGILPTDTRGMFAVCERFFALPQAQRDKVYLINSPHYRGYLPIGVLGQNTERPRDLLESFNVGMELAPDDPDVRIGRPLHGGNQWPDGLPGFRDAILHYYGLMDRLMRRLLQGFAMAADLPRDGFDHQQGRIGASVLDQADGSLLDFCLGRQVVLRPSTGLPQATDVRRERLRRNRIPCRKPFAESLPRHHGTVGQ